MEFETLLRKIIATPVLHAKWLNTLSYLENCGARKLAAFEHPTKVKKEMLKHAEEEFRHAHFFKKQIEKVSSTPLLDYSLQYILGGPFALNYLDRLECTLMRLLSNKQLPYLLISYAIEKRALALYSLYSSLLKEAHINIFLQSLLIEEQSHLREIEHELTQFPPSLLQLSLNRENEIWNMFISQIMPVLEPVDYQESTMNRIKEEQR